MADTLYFAYGSNLDLRQMRRRCPGSSPVGRARLPDYRLGFTRYSTKRKGGVADIVPEAGATTWGAIYTCTDADMESLDQFENVPHSYRRIDVVVLDDEENELEAVAYFANKTGEFAPGRDYLGLLITGSRDHKLPDEYIAALEAIRTWA
jgi:gamma-glutamylcyclotransferase (GGCT)/AIG2-like uncharacterized protein YtfP